VNMTKPTMTIEEARRWFAANKERLREKFAEMEDPPAELTPDGHLVGPTNELEFRRLMRELADSEHEEDDDGFPG
jgi:hypothetical protein